MTACPDCGAEEQHPEDCGHQANLAAECHRNALMPCPRHFSQCSGQALNASELGPGSAGSPFVQELMHLNADGFLDHAYYLWTGLAGRYAVPEGASRQEYLRKLPTVVLPPGAPPFMPQVAQLATFSGRAAVLSDTDTVEAVWHAARELEPAAMLSFMGSMAASARVNVEANPVCTVDHIAAYHLLGSQVNSGRQLAVLPMLVDMMVSNQREDDEGVLVAFRRLMDLPGHEPMVRAVDVVSRTLGQMIHADVAVMTTDGRPTAKNGWVGVLQGMVDVVRASPQDTNRSVMAGVWSVRAAQAYASCTSPQDATARLQQVVRDHGDPARFGVDVLMGATQILGYLAPAPKP